MKNTNALLMSGLIGLASIITIAVLLQRPADWLLIFGACGFTTFTIAWTGMYFRLKRELPEHALLAASFVNLAAALIGQAL